MSRTLETFLRSVNLRLDVEHPERLAHFRPTHKSVQVTEAIIRGEPSAASMVVAAYGSGKSIAAGAGALLVENPPQAQAVIETLTGRFDGVAPATAAFARERAAEGQRGAALLLEGAYADPVAALVEAAEARLERLRLAPAQRGKTIPVLNAIHEAARRQQCDRIALIWDEFGRHLETLAADGRPDELSVIQQIAEWAARQEGPSATLTLLLHQGFFHYADTLSQSARSAWRKIEGRFEAIRFVDDSRQMHELIAWVVEQSRPVEATPPERTALEATAQRVRELGYFDGFPDAAALATTLERAYPLQPAVLYLLPRLAARMAQNERTVFSFLNAVDLAHPVTLNELFEGFADAMRSDTGAGGTHRRWLEAQTALSRTEDRLEAAAIAATALLTLGQSGQRLRLSKDGLLFALDPYGELAEGEACAAVDRLIKRKLLLHRERTDDISVWHGTDLDLRGRLEEEKLRQQGAFDPVAYLSGHHPPVAWKPTHHNVANAIRRYFPGAWVAGHELLEAGHKHPLLQLNPGEDGRIVYALPSSAQEIAKLEALAADPVIAGRLGILLVIPRAPLPIAEIALEAACLERLKADSELIGQDPFALPEIEHMADAAHESLQRQLTRLTRPSPDAAWYTGGTPLEAQRDAALRARLSEIADQRFVQMPRIVNELLVRKRLSRPMANARKKAMLAVLEHTGKPALGFSAEATTPDASAYRTVFEHTGLYRSDESGGCWAAYEELPEDTKGLREVWLELEKFFTEPDKAKAPNALLEILQGPPYGVRFGVIPLLLAAALKAFGKAVAIRKDGAYLPDILPSHIEDLCADPGRYTVEAIALDPAREQALRRLVEIFGAQQAGVESDRLRHTWDALQAWKAQLPPAALRSRRVSAAARQLQLALRDATDPVELFLKTVPQITSTDQLDERAVERLDNIRRELEEIEAGYQAAAIQAVEETLSLEVEGATEDALAGAQAWADCFPEAALPTHRLDGTQRALLNQARQAHSGRHTEASFARALSTVLLGKDFHQWDDRTLNQFTSRLREVAQQIERAALECEAPDARLKPLVEHRLRELVHILGKMAEPEEISTLLQQLEVEEPEARSRQDDTDDTGGHYGQPQRSAN